MFLFIQIEFIKLNLFQKVEIEEEEEEDEEVQSKCLLFISLRTANLFYSKNKKKTCFSQKKLFYSIFLLVSAKCAKFSVLRDKNGDLGVFLTLIKA